jgi:hypothetical protein
MSAEPLTGAEPAAAVPAGTCGRASELLGAAEAFVDASPSRRCSADALKMGTEVELLLSCENAALKMTSATCVSLHNNTGAGRAVGKRGLHCLGTMLVTLRAVCVRSAMIKICARSYDRIACRYNCIQLQPQLCGTQGSFLEAWVGGGSFADAVLGRFPEHASQNIDVQRETEEEARQPETKLGPIPEYTRLSFSVSMTKGRTLVWLEWHHHVIQGSMAEQHEPGLPLPSVPRCLRRALRTLAAQAPKPAGQAAGARWLRRQVEPATPGVSWTWKTAKHFVSLLARACQTSHAGFRRRSQKTGSVVHYRRRERR